MAKKKTLEELQAEEARLEKEILQAKHRMTKNKNIVAYLKDRERKYRTHRLITKGAAFESIFPETICLKELEYLKLVEHMAEVPANQSLIGRAVYDHNRLEEKNGGET